MKRETLSIRTRHRQLWLAVTVMVAAICQVGHGQQTLSFGMRKLAFSANQFGIDLYRAMKDTDGNIAFCPFCIDQSLLMTLLGATGTSAMALRHVLYLWGMPPHELHAAARDLNTHLQLNLRADVANTNLQDRVAFSRASRLLRTFQRRKASMASSKTYGDPENESVKLYHSSKQALSSKRRTVSEELSQTDLVLFNSLYVQRNFGIKYPYQMYVYNYYNTSIHSLDFLMNPEEARQHINAVIEKQTGGKITDLLFDTPAENTNVLLFSGLYFHSLVDLDMKPVDNVQWIPASSAPPPSEDRHGLVLNEAEQALLSNPGTLVEHARSTQSDGEGRAVYGNPAMMEARFTRVRYTRHDYLNATAVEIPLKGGVISLVAISPANEAAMALLETRLSAQLLVDIMATMQIRRANLVMPRIHNEHTHHNLSAALSSMGLHNLFAPGRAELFDMSDVGWLHITNIFHKTTIDIQSEEPEEPLKLPQHNQQQRPHRHKVRAAAVSGASAPTNVNAGAEKDTIDIILNRPFLYFIIDNVSGLAIAMGKVANP